MRVPAPQELTFALCGAPSNSARAFGVMVHAQHGPAWSPAVSFVSGAPRMCFATVARVARGAVLAGCGAFGVGYSVLLSAGAMQPHMRSSSNFSCTGRAEARR